MLLTPIGKMDIGSEVCDTHCSSFPDEIEVTSTIRIPMQDSGKMLEQLLDNLLIDKMPHNKIAVVVAHDVSGQFIAAYSYDCHTLGFFTFREKKRAQNCLVSSLQAQEKDEGIGRSIVVGRTIAAPNHAQGYTEKYLFRWMRTVDVVLLAKFIKWMRGKTVGVTESGESVYYTRDVNEFFTSSAST